jgi:hypothetical protein
MRNLVGQIHRQFELLVNIEDGSTLPAIENSSVLLMVKGQVDIVMIECELEVVEQEELLDGLSVEVCKINECGQFIIRMDTSYREIFVPFIAEVCSNLSALGMPAAFYETMEDWRELWIGKQGRLSSDQERGLIGELLVVRSLLTNQNETVVQSWVGPLRKLHDFMSDKLHLEVKTTGKQPPTVKISQIAQVAPLHGEAQLALIVVGLTPGDELSLAKLVEELRMSIHGATSLLHFEKTLRRSGYRDEDEQHYRTMYTVSFIESHWITNESPVFDPAKLGNIPSTVRNISYTLDVFAMNMQTINADDWREFSLKLESKS